MQVSAPHISEKIDGRNLARLAAVQALYQMEHNEIGVEAVIREFEDFRLGGELDGVIIRDADSEHFKEIVRGVVELQGKLDPYIHRQLKEGWSLKRLDAIVRAILRCGIYEMVKFPNIPVRATIDEYIELAVSFFDQGADEARFVNAILDVAAKEVRADEFQV